MGRRQGHQERKWGTSVKGGREACRPGARARPHLFDQHSRAPLPGHRLPSQVQRSWVETWGLGSTQDSQESVLVQGQDRTGETVGTQGGDSFPSGGPAEVTMPPGYPSALCQVPHRAGDGPAPAGVPPNPTRLKAPYHSLMWIIHQFGVISEAFTSQLTSPGHPEFSSLTTTRRVLQECKSI